MTGPERRDESVAFSLKELMKLEDERVDEEREVVIAAEKRAAHERATREETEREERMATAAKEREDEARLEAMQRATVEQARITVEARTRAEEADRERAHERELTRMRLEGAKKPVPTLAIAMGVALAACVVFFVAVAKPASDRRIAELQGSVDGERARAGLLERQLEDQTGKLQSTQKDLEEARHVVLVAPVVTVAAPAVSASAKAWHAPVAKPPVAADKPCADPHDPLCFHIP